MLAAQLDGHRVETVESLSAGRVPQPDSSRRFKEEHALQCGFCTPAFLMTATALAARRTAPALERRSARSWPGSCAAAPATSSSSTPSTGTSEPRLARRLRGRAQPRRAERFTVTDTSVRDVAKHVRAPVVGANVPRKEDDRLLRGAGQFTDDVDPAHACRDGGRALPLPARPDRRGSTSPPPSPSAGVRQVLIGAEVAARTGPIGILRPVPGAPADPAFRARRGTGHLRGAAGRERRRHEPARRRGRARPDRDRVRAAPARLRRQLGAGAGGSGHPPRGARLQPA